VVRLRDVARIELGANDYALRSLLDNKPAVAIPVSRRRARQFYRQFALTIAISTVISAFNSLTLSPALAALLLRAHDAPPDLPTRAMNRLFGWFFRPFNRAFEAASRGYVATVRRVLRFSAVAIAIYVGLLALTWVGFQKVPSGFVPTQDKQYLVAFAELPDAASLDRSDAVIRRMSQIALETPGVENAIAFPGLSIAGLSNSPNAGIVFVGLKPFEERTTPDLYGPALAKTLNAKFASIEDAFVAIFPSPPVQGLGTIGGFKLYLEDRGDLGLEALHEETEKFLGATRGAPELAGMFTGYQVNVPQLDADLDRTKAKTLGIPITDVFETMQANLGSLYVNDFNRFGRTFQVTVQADAPYRMTPADVLSLKTRNDRGNMVPLASVLSVLVFLVLAAQYESWSLPLSVILIVPMCLLAAIAGVWIDGSENNVFTQIGLFVLVGLSCKNAILLVEFAKDHQEHEKSDPITAGLEACRLRLRPILMTSFAFIMGVWPLVVSKGAGAEMRHAMVVAVFSGMIGVTFFGLLLAPVWFATLRRLATRRSVAAAPAIAPLHAADVMPQA
jgi:multidrug efflux pump subunit AcrB